MVNPNMKPRQNYDRIPIGGVSRGMNSLSGHSAPRGFADTIDNMVFDPAGGIITRLGWKTISEGFEDEGSWPNAASGGWDSSTYGRFIDYINNDAGKVVLFEGAGLCDTATGIQFATATSQDITMPSGQTAFLGVVYFASTFLVYTENKLYSLNTANGALTEEVNFATDVGSDYGPIIKIFVRYGQLWVATKKDRLFWSDVGEYSAGAGTAVTDQPIQSKKAVWQTIYNGKITAFTALEGKQQRVYALGMGDDPKYDGWVVNTGKTYCYLNAFTSQLSNGDTIYASIFPYYYGTSKNWISSRTVDTVAAVSFAINSNVSAGATSILLTKDSDNAWQTLADPNFKGRQITIAEGATSEVRFITNVVVSDDYIRVYWDSTEPLANSYTTSGTVVPYRLIKVTVTSAWSDNYLTVFGDSWSTLSSAYYDTCLDPDNDDDCTGHIRLHSDAPGSEFRVDYTPYENDWASDESGWQDIAQNKGNTIAVAEGPGSDEEEGAGLIYVFKDNGDIHALTGKAGPGGTFGTLDIKFICSGIKARPNSIQVTREGVYFGALEGIRYQVYFIPHGDKWLNKELVALLTTDYWFDTDIPFDDSSYTIYERSFVFGGNMYGIIFPYSTSGLPSTNGYIYIGQAYNDQDRDGVFGRWCRMKENHKDEYEEDSGNTVAAGGEPSATGFYYHSGTLCKVYYLKTGHAFSGSTRYYEIAQYGWRAGGEECKDSHLYTYDAGGGSYTTESNTDYFKPKIKYPMIQADVYPLSINEIEFDADFVSGASGNGMDMSLTIYRDLDTAALTGYPQTVSDLTDASGSEKLLRRLKAKLRAKYIQLEFEFDNIRYVSKPAYLYWRGISLIAARLADRILSEEDINA